LEPAAGLQRPFCAANPAPDPVPRRLGPPTPHPEGRSPSAVRAPLLIGFLV